MDAKQLPLTKKLEILVLLDAYCKEMLTAAAYLTVILPKTMMAFRQKGVDNSITSAEY